MVLFSEADNIAFDIETSSVIRANRMYLQSQGIQFDDGYRFHTHLNIGMMYKHVLSPVKKHYALHVAVGIIGSGMHAEVRSFTCKISPSVRFTDWDNLGIRMKIESARNKTIYYDIYTDGYTTAEEYTQRQIVNGIPGNGVKRLPYADRAVFR